jgi:hypothetical protein
MAGTTLIVGQMRPDSAPAKGSGKLSGRVVADNGQPVKRARVKLSFAAHASLDGQLPHLPNVVDTDDNGRFAFADLPAGFFSITIEPPIGFVRRDEFGGMLAESESRALIVRLERTGAIEGRLRNTDGEAIYGAHVNAFRRIRIGPRAYQVGSAQRAVTDDRGVFRIFGLSPGNYYVVASEPPPPGPRMHEAPGPPVRLGYANTYYPGSTNRQAARTVRVRGGQDTRGVDFVATAARLAIIEVLPTNAAGAALGREASLTLTRKDDAYLDSSLRSVTVRENGRFVFEGVPPGDYVLGVAPRYGSEEAAYREVTVAGADLSLEVETNTGARVSGRILVNGRPAAAAELQTMSAHASRPPRQYGVSYAHVNAARAQEGGRFELTGLRGPMQLSASYGYGIPISIRRGATEIAGTTLDFAGTEIIDDVVVDFTTRVADVKVTVVGTGAPGEPQPVLIVLFSETPALWRTGYLRYDRRTLYHLDPRQREGSVGDDSEVKLSRMPEGRYLIAAFHDLNEIDDPTDPLLLEVLRQSAVPVTLVAGQTATATVKVANLDR